MSSDYDPIIERLEMLPPGREQIELFEDLIRLADANNDVQTGFAARWDYLTSAISEGFPEKGIVAFSWCVARYDEDPEICDVWELLWQFKVIQELIPIFATVTRQQIIDLQEDMAQRFQAIGESERTAHYYRSWNHMRMGDYDLAADHQKKYMKMRRTSMSDCSACERDRQIELLSRMHSDKAALRSAKKVLSGKMVCAEVPEFTYSHVLRSMLRLGKIDEAQALLQEAYDDVHDERKFLSTIADIVLAHLRCRNESAAKALFSRHITWANDTAAGELRFRFYDVASLFFEYLAGNQVHQLKLALPNDIGCYRDDGQYETVELASWFDQQARHLAEQFNARNGNQSFDNWRADSREIAGIG